MNKRVPPSGPPQAPIWLVGEAPGVEEEALLEPFVGRAGRQLDRELRASGILRSQCHLRNVMDTRPPQNDFSHFYLDGKARKNPSPELEQKWAELKRAIALHKPQVVVALGAEALRALTGHRDIMNKRGSLYQLTPETKVLATLHPSYVMRMPDWFQVAKADLKKADWEVRHPQTPLPQARIKIRPSLSDVRWGITKALNEKEMVGLDIECDVDTESLVSIAISWEGNEGICIPFYFVSPYNPESPSYWSLRDEAIVWEMLQQLLMSDVPKCFHNACFDLKNLRYVHGIPVNFTNETGSIDTMLAHHVLWPPLRKSLAFCVSIYTRFPYHKDLLDGSFEKLWEYNGLDAVTGRAVALELRNQLKREKMEGFYRKYVHPLIDPVTLINAKGMKVNEEARIKSCEAELKRLNEARGKMCRIVDTPDFNPGSPKQVAEALYVKLGFPKQYHHKSKKVTTEWKEVEHRLKKAASTPEQEEFLLAIEDYRGAQNVLSNWLRYDIKTNQPLPLKDGCLHTFLDIAGTVSGRPSSGKDAKGTKEDKINKEGSNLLNVPHGPCRKMVIPDSPELVFLACDLSAAEARVVAYESGCRYQIEAFERGESIHIVNAGILYPGEPITKSSEPKSKYMLSKKIVHLTNYGGTKYVAAPLLGITQALFEEKQKRYFALCPEIRAWQNRTWEEVQHRRVLVTAFGRRLQFLGRLDANKVKRSAISFRPQATVSDLTSLVEAEVWKEIELPERIFLHHYDALVLLVLRSKVDYWTSRLKELFNKPIRAIYTNRTYTIPCEVSVGETWDDV